jgi:hypothetical protein
MADDSAGFGVIFLQNTPRIWGDELAIFYDPVVLVPVVHGTTYEALREISPLLASRNGLNTLENAMADVAAKLAELVAL